MLGKVVATAGGVKIPSGSPPAATAANTPILATIADVCPAVPSGGAVDYAAVPRAQRTFVETQQLKTSASLLMKPFAVDGAELLCDVSMGWCGHRSCRLPLHSFPTLCIAWHPGTGP
jgi:hypothetical protein